MTAWLLSVARGRGKVPTGAGAGTPRHSQPGPGAGATAGAAPALTPLLPGRPREALPRAEPGTLAGGTAQGDPSQGPTELAPEPGAGRGGARCLPTRGSRSLRRLSCLSPRAGQAQTCPLRGGTDMPNTPTSFRRSSALRGEVLAGERGHRPLRDAWVG